MSEEIRCFYCGEILEKNFLGVYSDDCLVPCPICLQNHHSYEFCTPAEETSYYTKAPVTEESDV